MSGETFKCYACKRRVPWSFGADDDLPDFCDHCWFAAHLGEQLATKQPRKAKP